MKVIIIASSAKDGAAYAALHNIPLHITVTPRAPLAARGHEAEAVAVTPAMEEHPGLAELRAEVEPALLAARATLHLRYPEVAPFVASMYEELLANSHKGDQAGWLLMTMRQAWQEVSWHSAKLAVAIKSNDELRIREYAADIANGCMMLVDILNHGEVDRCRCGWPTTIANAACPWHEMRDAKGETPTTPNEEGSI